MLVIKPSGGLSNYLRVIFSYYEYARLNSEDKKIIVLWDVTSPCNGFFLDYFEPVENIEFINTRVDKKRYNELKNHKIDYNGCYQHKDYNPNYEKLKVLPSIKNKIDNLIKILDNDYIALHIRRTDHIQLAKKYNKYTTDEDFFNFIENSKNNKEIEYKNIYVATDNIETYDLFKKKYNLKLNYHKTLNTLRKTSMEDAIIDIFMCGNAKIFKGSGGSTFSNLIDNIRELKNKT